MSAEHELPDNFVLEQLRGLEDKIQAIEQLHADGIVDERKRNAAIFSDAQDDRIESKIARALLAFAGSDLFANRVTKEVKFIAGSEALRFWVYVVGSFALGAISVIVKDYFKAH